MTAPQPSRKARLITLKCVQGGPERIIKGLGSFRPLTVVARVDISDSFVSVRFHWRCSSEAPFDLADAVRDPSTGVLVEYGSNHVNFQTTNGPNEHDPSSRHPFIKLSVT